MKQYKKCYELKNAAKDKLDGKYGGAVLICFLNLIIPGATFTLIDTFASSTRLLTGPNITMDLFFDTVTLLLNLFFGILQAGIVLYFLNIACDQPRSVNNLFYGFQTDSKKIFLVSGAMILCNVLYLQPQQYLAQRYLATRQTEWLLAAIAFMVIGLCIYIPVSLGINLALYVMFDFPQHTARETLAMCWRMMRGHKKRFFLLQCSFLPLMLLCILSFGIGFLWLSPYMNMTYTYFFLDLMNPKEITES